jgi:hypothetical protein
MASGPVYRPRDQVNADTDADTASGTNAAVNPASGSSSRSFGFSEETADSARHGTYRTGVGKPPDAQAK